MATFSQPLATESFSYSWLETEPSSSETEHNVIRHQEADRDTMHTFDFTTNPAVSVLVHADKLFSNGVIKPQFLDEATTGNNHVTNNNSHISCSQSSGFVVDSRRHCHEDFQKIFPRKRSMFLKRFFCKYLECLIPAKGRRCRIRVDDVNRRTLEVKNCNNDASPRIRRHSSGWSDSDESSIHEAILYCKRSSGSFS